MILKEKRSDRIYVMVSPAEKEMLESGAETLGYRTLSDFIRDVATKKIKRGRNA
jgi:uncharacterized protein (DUF1778 family)